MIDDAGRVAGIAFAIAPDKPNVGYAISTDQIQTDPRRRSTTQPIDTGPLPGLTGRPAEPGRGTTPPWRGRGQTGERSCSGSRATRSR